MAESGVKLDPDDMFDKVVFVEDQLQMDGYNAGFSHGQTEGKLEGFALGIQQGREIGREIGFYKGFVNTWQVVLENDPRKRTNKILQQLNDLLERFKCDDPENDDLQDMLAQIRTKFKQLSVLLKIPTDTGQGSNQGLSF